MVYVLIDNCPGINPNAVSGDMWMWTGTDWVEFTGSIPTV